MLCREQKISLIMEASLQKRLGHANIEITWRVYSHLLKVLKSEEVAMPDNIIYF